MDFQELIKNRYSVRSFAPDAVEDSKINAILEAAQIAPTARNFQPQRILIAKSEEAMAKIRECTPCHYGAPLVFVVCYDKNVECTAPERNMYFGQQDATIAMTHMMLAVEDLGLGSVWVGMFFADKIRELFDIPESYEIIGLLPVGYKAPDAAPSENHSNTISLEEMVKEL